MGSQPRKIKSPVHRYAPTGGKPPKPRVPSALFKHRSYLLRSFSYISRLPLMGSSVYAGI
ncbi:hypothetical protein GCM10007418_06900 [Halopseudomonas salina]|uniref:Uncharacterized protein n=1 Tax=Halopseudomonas salina TaxID=1323744 RepID=A0ABQ1P3V0_9GAMM|nr:hypothetical protein GCM10007418_06900 [Halopseudomonas salina]